MWSVDIDGRNARRLIRVYRDDKPQATICDFGNKQYSSDSRYLYFETGAWVTSSAIHVYDFNTNKERYVLPGNGQLQLFRFGTEELPFGSAPPRQHINAGGITMKWIW